MSEGFHSEQLQAALRDAIAGRPAELERLLSCLGAVVTARPNVKLAAAFAAEIAAARGDVAPLLRRLGAEDAAPDTDRAFLPIAAAHGWAARVRAGKDVATAWAALEELAADERAPVRLGTKDALVTLGLRPGGADELCARAAAWLDSEDRELRFGAAALVIEVLGERRVLAGVHDLEALLDYVGRVIAEVADAPRSAERSDGRRRLLAALPPSLAAFVALGPERDRAARWFAEQCAAAEHPAVRAALSDATVRLRAPSHGKSVAVADELRGILEGSAKPLRDPTRVRPGMGRGKASRRTR